MIRPFRALAACSALAAVASFAPATAAAQDYLVTSTDDVASILTDGRCQIPFSTACTLRAAVQAANVNPGPDRILLPGGRIIAPTVYRLTVAGRDEDDAGKGDLDVKGPLTVTVAGGARGIAAGSPIIDGGAIDRVFDVGSAGSLVVSTVTIRNGDPGPFGDGGGIRSIGELVLSGATVTGNKAREGGGIYGRVTATSSTFSNNTAAIRGGAISAGGTSLTRVVVTRNAAPSAAGLLVFGNSTITESTFDHNVGGAIENQPSRSGEGTMTISESTITQNGRAQGSGGGIHNAGSLTVSTSTIERNSAPGAGGGIYNEGTAALSETTLVANNAPLGANVFTAEPLLLRTPTTTAIRTIFAQPGLGASCGGPVTSQGRNLEDGTSCFLAGPGDISNRDPLLAALADNGGPTQTRALRPGSPAIDAGGSACSPEDQRGVPRPTGAACDIGAYEFAVTADLAVTLAASPSQVQIGQPITYTATVMNKGPNPATGVTFRAALPAGATLVSAEVTRLSTAGSVSRCTRTPPVTCDLGDLRDQEGATITIVATPTTAGTARNTVSVRALQVDPDATTDSARADVVVTALLAKVGGAGGFTAKITSIRARRIEGRARVTVVLVVSKAVTTRASLLFRRRTLAAETATLKAGRRTLSLAAQRPTGRGRYLVRLVLTDARKHRGVLRLGVLLP